MTHLVYLIANRTLVATDCTVFLEYFKFLSWTQLNDRAVAVATDLGYVKLSNGFRVYITTLAFSFIDIFSRSFSVIPKVYCSSYSGQSDQYLMSCMRPLATPILSLIPPIWLELVLL